MGNPSGSALCARSTTLMPNKLGLGSILAMIFSPNVEMRVDRSLRRYTGCLLGLGHHPEKPIDYSGNRFESYNPDHDIELSFDADISNDDLEEINKIRFYINEALTNDVRRRDAESQDEQRRRQGTLKISVENAVIEYQDKIRECLDLLLFKQRQPKSKEAFINDYKWGLLRKENYPRITLSSLDVDDKNYFLKMITRVDEFQDLALMDRAEEVLEVLKDMKRLAITPANRRLGKELTCPVCPGFAIIREPHVADRHL